MAALPVLVVTALALTPLAAVPVPVPVPEAPAAAAVDCEITDASLTWGFKESFRAYIDGDIANGEWTTAGDASYETPVFTWSGGTGTYTPLYDRATITFAGSVRFTGHDGLLDTTISDPVVRFTGGSGEIVLDVSGPTMDGTPIDEADVPFVAMPSLEVVGGDAVRTVDAATELTAEGAIAFPNYEAGEAFDPVAIEMTVGKTCPVVPSGDGLADQHDDGWPALIGPLAGGVAFVLVTLAGIFFATRRRGGGGRRDGAEPPGGEGPGA